MDKWEELKKHLIEQLHLMDERDDRFEGYVQVLSLVQDIDAVEITNKTHGHEGIN